MGRTRLLLRVGILVALSIALAACGGDEEEAAAVSDGNHAPTISGTPAATVSQGTSYSFTPAAADPDGDAGLRLGRRRRNGRQEEGGQKCQYESGHPFNN